MAYHNATWEEHLDASERILRWMITHNGDKPNYVTIAGEKFTPAEYEDANKRVQKWIDDPANKGKPKPKVRYGVASQPVWDGVYREQKYTEYDQSDKYSCGSTTAANILSTWGIRTNEAEMDRYCRTGTHGTNPEDLISGVLRKLKESGYKKSRCDTYKTSDFGSETNAVNTIGKYMADPSHSVAVLIRTDGSGWKKYYTGTYEHWVMPVLIDTKNKIIKVNDPARSFLLSFTYNEFMTGVRLVSRKSWYVFVAKN